MTKTIATPASWLLVSFLMAVPAFADSTANLQFVATTTSDSHIEVKAQIPKELATWVWFRVAKSDGKGQADFIYSNDGSPLDMNLYLEAGAGNYSAMLMTSMAVSEYGNQYKVIQTFALQNTDTRDMSYLFPSSEVQSDSPEIIALSKQITAGLSNDFDKAEAIHDWVAKNIAYDVDALNEFQKDGTLPPQSALNALNGIPRKAVCEGYSDLVAALNRAAGIPTKIIVGTLVFIGGQGSHAWNEFLSDGKWILEDATLDAGPIDGDTGKFLPMFSHQYFNADPKVFAQDHVQQSVTDL